MSGAVLAHQGFRVVIQSCRGTGGSGGKFDRPFGGEVEDGLATVEWLRQQPWFQGHFATVGLSYLAYTQLALATAAPPELSAMVLQVAPLSARSAVYPEDELGAEFIIGWATDAAHSSDMSVRSILKMIRTAPHRRRVTREMAMAPPLIPAYRMVSEQKLPFFEDWITHPDGDDPFWRDFDQRGALERINVPVLIQGGWYDPFARDAIEIFERLKARGVPAELTMGAWTHTGAGTPKFIQDDMLPFLRSVLEGEGPGRPRPVRLQTQPKGDWYSADSWPPARTSVISLWLSSDGLKDEPGDATERTFTFDPAHPTPSIGGAYINGGIAEQSALESRPDVATFTSLPSSKAFALAGEPTLHIARSATAPGHLFARLSLVDAAGKSRNLSETLRRVSPSVPSITMTLPPVFTVVEPGERLRLVLAGGAHPRWLRHPGTDDPIALATVFNPVTHTIAAGGDTGSRLELPSLMVDQMERA